MARKFLPCIIALPVLLAAWLTFSAPAPMTVSPDQIVAFEYPATEEAAEEYAGVTEFAEQVFAQE